MGSAAGTDCEVSNFTKSNSHTAAQGAPMLHLYACTGGCVKLFLQSVTQLSTGPCDVHVDLGVKIRTVSHPGDVCWARRSMTEKRKQRHERQMKLKFWAECNGSV